MLSLKRFSKNLSGAFREGADIIVGYPKRFAEKSTAGKLVSAFKVAGMGISVPLSMALTEAGVFSPESVMGAIALSSAFVLTRFENNNHMNALGAVGTYLLTAQLVMLDALGFAAFAGVGAARMTVMAMMPDGEQSQKGRSRMAVGFALASAGLIGAAALVKQEAMELIPLLSVAFGTWASSRINERSDQARAGYVVANTNNMIYGYMYAGSAAAAFSALMNNMNLITTILHKDKPEKGWKDYVPQLLR